MNNIIDGKFKVVQPPQKKVSWLGLALVLAAAVSAAGPAFDLWSGDETLRLLALVVGAGFFAVRKKLSKVYQVSAWVGIVAVLMVSGNNTWVGTAGLVLLGLVWLVMRAIENRGWNYDN